MYGGSWQSQRFQGGFCQTAEMLDGMGEWRLPQLGPYPGSARLVALAECDDVCASVPVSIMLPRPVPVLVDEDFHRLGEAL